MNKKTNKHAKFFALLKDIPGDPNEKKEYYVKKYSSGKTTSLSVMREQFSAEYAEMILDLKREASKNDPYKYEDDRAMWQNRVLAAVYESIEKAGYQFENVKRRRSYAISVACRAGNCSDFGKMPISVLQRIYSQYVKQNKVDVHRIVELKHSISQN